MIVHDVVGVFDDIKNLFWVFTVTPKGILFKIQTMVLEEDRMNGEIADLLLAENVKFFFLFIRTLPLHLFLVVFDLFLLPVLILNGNLAIKLRSACLYVLYTLLLFWEERNSIGE